MLHRLGKMIKGSTNLALLLTVLLSQILFPFGSAQSVYATKPVDEPKITICHRDSNVKQPYGPKAIAVDQSAVNGGGHDDHSSHTGPVATSEAVAQALKDAHEDWGDIIPPFDGYSGLNWTPEGRAIYNNDCQYVITTPTVESGSVTVNKQVDVDGDGAFEVTTNAGANALGFRWGLDGDSTNNLMGSTEDEVSVGNHEVDEKDVNGYHFTGWFSGQGSCDDPETTSGLPISVNVTADADSEITLCNAADEIDLGQVTICHRTDAVKNPYERITVDESAVDGEGHDDHTSHTGPVATSEEVAQALKDNKENWGDIIPPTDNDPDGMNWTTEGQAVYNNDCKYVVTETDTGTLTVNKAVDADRDGTFEGGNTEANTLGFAWLLDDETTERDMGTSATVGVGDHDVDENDVSGYEFVGWFSNDGDGSCSNPDGITLPVGVNVAKDETTVVTLCNAAEEESETQVTFCHATGSETHPFEQITISPAGAFNGHLDDGSGGIHGDHQDGRDIIPPFEFNGQTYQQNWDAVGQAIWRAGCLVTPQPDSVLIIQKLVNGQASADSTIGGVVTYTLIVSVPEDSGTVYDAKVIDLPPENFEYISGSETATKGHLEHAYASPGIWSLGTLSPGQVVTLTYQAFISHLVTPGDYPDLAFASGFSSPGSPGNPDVFSNVHLASATNPFVGTTVKVAQVDAPGQVLGISTLPATASPFNLFAAIFPPALFGIGYFLFERRREQNRGRT